MTRTRMLQDGALLFMLSLIAPSDDAGPLVAADKQRIRMARRKAGAATNPLPS